MNSNYQPKVSANCVSGFLLLDFRRGTTTYIKEQMQKHDLFSKYTMQSLLDGLDVIECFTEPGKAPMQGEVPKKQEDLFIAMGVMLLYAKHCVETAGI